MESKQKNVLKTYFRWPFVLGILPVIFTVIAFIIGNRRIGIAAAVITLIYYLAATVFYLVYRRNVLRRLADFGASFAQVQSEMIRKIHIPFAMCDKTGDILWCNQIFQETFHWNKPQGMLTSVFPEMETADFDNVTQYHLTFEDRHYELTATSVDTTAAEGIEELRGNANTKLYHLYLIDETDLVKYRSTLEEERTVMALIFVDNYDDVMDGIEYVRRSLLSALIERRLNKYFESVDGVIRKIEKDRYFVVMKQSGLWRLEEDRFSLIEDIKTVSIGNETAVTLSIGIGINGTSVAANYEYARQAVDMALSRGGDQVVLKDGTDIKYFGGKSQSTERNTRVKARVKAHALRELIESKEAVMIMGHPISDLDCLGAAIALYRAASFSGKKTYIVMGRTAASVAPLLDTFKGAEEYPQDLFIDRNRALELYNKETLVIVVDTSRPSYTECPDLLKRASDIVVMDHHRRSKDAIDNAVLSYVEPYASSASELVAELIQYYDENLRLKPQEADAVFAGIVMDTNNFEDKSGVRTFEVAAYLRRSGADVTRVRKLFRDSMEDYKLRAEIISKAEVFRDDYIIGICPKASAQANQTVVAAQAANELLEIRGIKASFVLTEYNDMIYVSARSIDEVNVQVMMEKLGGGGHLSVAGAQFVNTTIEEVLEKVKEVIVAEEHLPDSV